VDDDGASLLDAPVVPDDLVEAVLLLLLLSNADATAGVGELTPSSSIPVVQVLA